MLEKVQDDKAAKSGLANRMMRLPKVVWRSSAQQTKYAKVMKLKVGKLDEWNEKTHKRPVEHHDAWSARHLSGVADQWRGGSSGW